jgi:hypothetical protein
MKLFNFEASNLGAAVANERAKSDEVAERRLSMLMLLGCSIGFGAFQALSDAAVWLAPVGLIRGDAVGLELRCSRLLQCRARKDRREREGLAARSFETVPLPLAAPTLSGVLIINRHPCVMSTIRKGCYAKTIGDLHNTIL